MDKEKIRKILKESTELVKLMEQKFPKTQNMVGSLLWNFKNIADEIEKPDPVPEATTVTKA